MSQSEPWGTLPSYEPDPPPAPSTGVNGWGIAGFVIGIVSLCALGGILAPIGLLLSMVGLFKTPRGWGVAGLCTNLACLCCCLPASLPFLLVMVGAVSIGGMTLWFTDNFKNVFGPVGVTAFHAAVIGTVAIMYFAEHQKVPPTLEDLKLEKGVLLDGWGRPFGYELTDDPEGFKLWSTGGDGALGTGDDVEFRGQVRGGQLDFQAAPRRRTAPNIAPPKPPTNGAVAPSGDTAPPDGDASSDDDAASPGAESGDPSDDSPMPSGR